MHGGETMDDGNRKIRIAYCIQDLHTGGAERVLLDLIAHLDPRRFDVILITLRRRGELFERLPATICQTFCTANPLRLYSILKCERVDVFHTHLWRADVLGVPVARLAGVKRVCSTRHNVNYFPGLKCILAPLYILAMHLAHTVIVVSEAVRASFCRNPFYKAVDVAVISNGVDVQRFGGCREKKHGEDKTIHLLTVATLKRKKGHVPFLEVLQHLRDIPWVWRLVGDGPEKEHIQRKAAELGIADRIEFHGMQNDTVRFYAQADVFVLPSLREGLPLALVEAMAAGVPVTGSEIEPIRNLLEGGKAGLLFDLHDPKVAAETIRQFLNDPQQQNTTVERAKQIARQYSIEIMTDRYMNLYSDMVCFQNNTQRTYMHPE